MIADRTASGRTEDESYDESKLKIFDMLDYKPYSIITPLGIISAINYPKDWKEDELLKYNIVDNDATKYKITKNGLSKVYYNKLRNILYVYLLPSKPCIVKDLNVPFPLKKEYYFYLRKFKYYEAKITDARLMEEFNNEMKYVPNHNNFKYQILIKDTYFKLLSNCKI